MDRTILEQGSGILRLTPTWVPRGVNPGKRIKLHPADLFANKYHAWPAFSKFFDNKSALPFHMHHRAEHAALMGAQPKPESYDYPLQLNSYLGDFPFTFFGIEPGVTKEEVYH